MIIGGIVRYEDGIKTTTGDQFSPTRKVAVELNFAVEEGADAIAYVQNVLDTAIALTNSKLGLKVPTAAAVATTAPEAPKRAPGRPKKAEPPKADPAEMSEGPLDTPHVQEAQTTAAGAAPSVTDPAAMSEEFVAEPLAPEITDADLNKAIQVVNAKIKAPQKIKELMHAFNPDTTKQMTVRAIPQAQRKSFIDKLNALS